MEIFTFCSLLFILAGLILTQHGENRTSEEISLINYPSYQVKLKARVAGTLITTTRSGVTGMSESGTPSQFGILFQADSEAEAESSSTAQVCIDQNVVDGCLSVMENLPICVANDFKCLCTNADMILGCTDKCLDDPRRPGDFTQREAWCSLWQSQSVAQIFATSGQSEFSADTTSTTTSSLTGGFPTIRTSRAPPLQSSPSNTFLLNHSTTDSLNSTATATHNGTVTALADSAKQKAHMLSVPQVVGIITGMSVVIVMGFIFTMICRRIRQNQRTRWVGGVTRF